MSVTVIYSGNNEITYSTASAFEVDNGHLALRDEKGKLVAVFPINAWNRAEITDAGQVVRP